MKTNKTASAGFTLIELLIVIAIIAILALIAIPNFLEAQTRSKVARCMADMRTVAVGIEAMRTDKNMLLVDFWGDDSPAGQNRLKNDFALPFQGQNLRGGMTGIYVPLTTPVAYLTSLPKDPFCTTAPDMSNLVANDQLPPYTFMYKCWDTSVSNHKVWMPDGSVDGDYLMFSPGPDKVYWVVIGGNREMVLYDPSNGTISSGEIVYSSRFSFKPSYPH